MDNNWDNNEVTTQVYNLGAQHTLKEVIEEMKPVKCLNRPDGLENHSATRFDSREMKKRASELYGFRSGQAYSAYVYYTYQQYDLLDTYNRLVKSGQVDMSNKALAVLNEHIANHGKLVN